MKTQFHCHIRAIGRFQSVCIRRGGREDSDFLSLSPPPSLPLTLYYTHTQTIDNEWGWKDHKIWNQKQIKKYPQTIPFFFSLCFNERCQMVKLLLNVDGYALAVYWYENIRLRLTVRWKMNWEVSNTARGRIQFFRKSGNKKSFREICQSGNDFSWDTLFY